MKKIIIDERMRQEEKNKLKELGYNLIEINKRENVYEEISSHVDIFICKVGNKIIIEPGVFKIIKEQLKEDFYLEEGEENVGSKYPNDIKYNVCTIGKKAFHNFQFCETKIIEELKSQKYELINTNQGYTNCSIAVIDDNSAIVTDKGLYKILQKQNIDVLYIDYEPDIKLLDSNGYSSRTGFIGGAISKIGNKVIIFGELNKIDKEQKIRKFITTRNLQIIEFKGLDVIDYGGMVEV